MAPNNSFKPNLLRYGNGVAEEACHAVACTAQVGLTRALAVMSPHKVDRARVKQLTDLPNVGKAAADDLRLLGYHSPEQLADECPFEMYEQLCQKTGRRHDPCVIDVFMSVTHFMKGEPPRPWWEFTETRKKVLTGGSSK